jgi:hypothetical protein
MFKELKVLKLVLFITLLVLIIINVNVEKYAGVYFYPSKPSYQIGENIEINIGNSIDNQLNTSYKISNWDGKILLEEPISETLEPTNLSMLYSNGFDQTINKNLSKVISKTGLYFINDTLPFFVNSKDSKDITVIYPSLGNLLINRFGEHHHNAFDDISKTIWSQRPIGMDEKSRNLMHFLKDEFGSSTIEYVSDLDPKIGEIIKKSKLLIIYGYSRYTTDENWKSINEYIFEGGKVLFFNTYLPEYSIDRLNERQLKLKFNGEGVFDILIDSLIPFHFNEGGYATKMTYEKVNNINSPLPYNSIKVNANGNLFVGSEIGDYWYTIPTNYKDLNGQSGIIIVNNQLISMGTEEWLADENFNEEEIRNTTKEVINYLLKIK